MPEVTAYTIWNQQWSWDVDGDDKAREYAKRIVMEGLWVPTGDGEETFYPIDKVAKVKVSGMDEVTA